MAARDSREAAAENPHTRYIQQYNSGFTGGARGLDGLRFTRRTCVRG